MAKVFTITEGLENLGALKTGGQGSVYKGKRIGEIFTAIKLLPTPIHCEDENDKNYRSFKNEVAKLQKVNEEPNPNVVTILGSGITETGCLPFIEMEFIEGPDLGELLKPPHDPVFTIQEAIKVATHLSNALAHCHQCDIKHGDIKSNNVKFNQRTGNYMLLDFGLAVMSDEDRRTSLRHAGAIEFMAPEQNQGDVLFQTDTYSFGVIIYELLAGRVPFPLQDSGETARNAVMVSHMETPPPDLMQLREQNLPSSWDAEKRNWEMQVPEWLLTLVYTCLEKKPEDRFKDGIELHDFVVKNSIGAAAAVDLSDDDRIKELKKEKDDLKKQLSVYQKAAEENEERLRELRAVILQHEQDALATPINSAAVTPMVSRRSDSVPKKSFYALMIIAGILAAISIYSLVLNPRTQGAISAQSVTDSTDTANVNTMPVENNSSYSAKGEEKNSDNSDEQTNVASETRTDADAGVSTSTAGNDKKQSDKIDGASKKSPVQVHPITDSSAVPTPLRKDTSENDPSVSLYKVRSKAYFHNAPDVATRRKAFINHWNNAVLKPLKETDKFIYIVFTNVEGQTSKGWLQKKDLIAVN